MPKEVIVTYTQKLDVPEDKLAEYKESFDLFDTNHDGLISANEIYRIMKKFGNPISKKELGEIIADLDSSGDGQIDFEEFVSLMEKQVTINEISEEDAVIKAFKELDHNHDGKIYNYEFKYFLTQVGDLSDAFSKEELDELFRTCDLDPQGELNYVEFVNNWKAGKY